MPSQGFVCFVLASCAKIFHCVALKCPHPITIGSPALTRLLGPGVIIPSGSFLESLLEQIPLQGFHSQAIAVLSASGLRAALQTCWPVYQPTAGSCFVSELATRFCCSVEPLDFDVSGVHRVGQGRLHRCIEDDDGYH